MGRLARSYKGRLLGAGLFLLALSPIFSAEQVIGPFSGLNNTDNPAVIPAENAQDLLNVDLSDGGRSIIKRDGYGLAYALSVTTSPVHGTYSFYDANGNVITLAFNDTRMTSTTNDGPISVLFSTGTNGATYQCTDSQGFAYCVNTNRTNTVKTNGATYSHIFPAAQGTIIAVTPDRMAMSGFTSFPNRVDFSAAADFPSWTTGVAPTSAFNFTISAPGSKITHLAYAFNRIMWFKDASFGYILQGATASDWVVQTVSPNIGTLDNSSVYYQGILYFRGQDSHYWAYDGSNLTKLSRDINGSVEVSQSRSTGLWTQTESSDFAVGFSTPIIYADTITVSGRLSLTFPDLFSNFRDGSNGTKDVWDQFYSSGTVGTSSITSGAMRFTIGANNGLTGRSNIRSIGLFPDFSQGTTYYTVFKTISLADAAGGIKFRVLLSTEANSTRNPDQLNSHFYASFASTSPGYAYVDRITNTTDGAQCTNCSGDIAFPLTVQFYLSTTSYRLTVNDVSISAGTHSWPRREHYAYLSFQNTSNGTSYGDIDTFGVAPQILTYNSVVNNAPNLTAWGDFNDSEIFSGSSQGQDIYIRASTNPIAINSSTPSWTFISSGERPSISTGTYMQIRDVFTTALPLSNQGLESFTLGWLEGNATDKAYATYFDNAVWWSIAYGTGATTNNHVFKYDLDNNAWLRYDISANGFYVKGDQLYFGSSASGKVYLFGKATNDDGEAINAYWKSKDFFVGSPFTDDDITGISTFFSAVSNSSMTVTYTINGSSTNSYEVPLTRSNASFGKNNRALPLGTVGNTLSIQVGNNAADQPFEVFAIEYKVNPKSWRPGE